MGVDLVRSGRVFHLNWTGWNFYLELAFEQEWRPAGTVPPDIDNSVECRGGYYSNDGSKVTAEDAIGIAEALEKSLEDVPNRDAMAGKVISLMMPDGKIIKVFQSDTAVTAHEYFSGEGKKWVLEFIAFCREGPFDIW